MKLSQLKHGIPRANLQIAEWMNEISIEEETHSEIVRQKLKLYSTSSCPIFRDYMETIRSEWEEEEKFTEDQVRSMDLNKYNNILTSERWSTKDPKDANILALVIVS